MDYDEPTQEFLAEIRAQHQFQRRIYLFFVLVTLLVIIPACLLTTYWIWSWLETFAQMAKELKSSGFGK